MKTAYLKLRTWDKPMTVELNESLVKVFCDKKQKWLRITRVKANGSLISLIVPLSDVEYLEANLN